MSIWFQPPDLKTLNECGGATLARHLGIHYTAVGADFLAATMPVNAKTRQPFGILHGGASVALAETTGSIAGNLCVDPERFYCVGLEINANHIGSVRAGLVTAIARALHLGRSTQVWEIRIRDETERLACVSRLTLAVIGKSPAERKRTAGEGASQVARSCGPE